MLSKLRITKPAEYFSKQSVDGIVLDSCFVLRIVAEDIDSIVAEAVADKTWVDVSVSSANTLRSNPARRPLRFNSPTKILLSCSPHVLQSRIQRRRTLWYAGRVSLVFTLFSWRSLMMYLLLAPSLSKPAFENSRSLLEKMLKRTAQGKL